MNTKISVEDKIHIELALDDIVNVVNNYIGSSESTKKPMLTCLTDEEAHTLASRYDFSGGQCENVLRKATIEHIVNGTPSSFEQIDIFCQEETEIQKSSQLRHIAGFSIAS